MEEKSRWPGTKTKTTPSPASGEIEKENSVERVVGPANVMGLVRRRRPELEGLGRVSLTWDPPWRTTSASPKRSMSGSKLGLRVRDWVEEEEG